MASFWTGFINKSILGLANVLTWLINLLPSTPFELIDNSSVSDYIGYLNFVVPINQIIAILEAWVFAVLVYYTYMVIARWIKLL